MSEYIERQRALDTVFRSHSVEGAHRFLAAIPAADVQPVRRGTWTDAAITADNLYDTQGMLYQIRGYICSCCHEYSLARFNFCPNCGCAMEVSK